MVTGAGITQCGTSFPVVANIDIDVQRKKVPDSLDITYVRCKV